MIYLIQLSINTCGYNDVKSTMAIEIAHDGNTVVIDGTAHYVFKYTGLTAEMMTDIVYVRPVITLSDGTEFEMEPVSIKMV